MGVGTSIQAAQDAPLPSPENGVTEPEPTPETETPDISLPEFASSPRGGIPKPGEDVLIIQTSGERLEGTYLSETAFLVLVQIAGVEVSIDRSTIERVVLLDPPVERYRRMRGLIADDDADRLVLLAEWLQRQRLFKEALVELDAALEADPSHAEALRVRRIVANQAALAERSGRGAGESEDEARQRARAARFPDRPKPGEFPLLSEDDINLLKVYEVDLRDPPAMTIAREVIERLMVQYGDHPLIPEERGAREAFQRKPAEEILDVMFRLRAREFYGEVRVRDQPRSMRLFRDHVHAGWMVSSCASTACHGGSESGRLRLFNYRPTAEASVYTNFLILERFKTRDGSMLIDYEQPERSLLLQMGLPRDDARQPHPQVPGWGPAFRNREARRFQQTVEWIRSMYRPRPEYPVEYQPPGEQETADEPGPREPVER